MENPATWGEAEKVIYKALTDVQEARDNMICGLSAPARIAGALRLAGLLKESSEEGLTETDPAS